MDEAVTGVALPELSTALSAGGSVMSRALWTPCRARGEDFKRSGMTLFMVSFAFLDRLERRLACGGTIMVGWSLPIFVSSKESRGRKLQNYPEVRMRKRMGDDVVFHNPARGTEDLDGVYKPNERLV